MGFDVYVPKKIHNYIPSSPGSGTSPPSPPLSLRTRSVYTAAAAAAAGAASLMANFDKSGRAGGRPTFSRVRALRMQYASSPSA